MRRKTRKVMVVLLAGSFLGLAILAEQNLFSQSQDQSQQPSTGPAPSAGTEVIVPKKKKSAPKPPPKKKPEKINPAKTYNISTTTNLVNVAVTVLDKNGDPITGLRQDNFRIYDDGVAQTISNFGTTQAPMTVTMLIEFSDRWWGFVYLALEYAYQFLNFMQPKDWVAVVSFGMSPHIMCDFTHNRSKVRQALDQLRMPSFSEVNLYDGIAFTLDRMKNIKGRKAIILICTGIDTFSKLTYSQCLKIVRSSDTAIYPISIMEFVTIRSGDTITTLQAQNALNTFAKYSGGQAFFPRFEGALPGIYQQIAAQLRTEYSLGFVPSTPQNGKFHQLKVELVDQNGNPLKILNKKGKKVKYHILARDGYTAGKG